MINDTTHRSLSTCSRTGIFFHINQVLNPDEKRGARDVVVTDKTLRFFVFYLVL